MAITYLGQILVPRPSGLAFTEDLTPLGLQDGDLVVVGYHVTSNTDRNIGVTTAGYTEEAELFANDTYDANLSVSWKVMGPTPDADVSLSSTGSSSHPGHVSIRAYRGVDATTPMDAARTTATGTNGLLVNPPAITPVTSGALVVIFGNGAAAQASLATPYASSDLTDFNSGLVSDFYDLAWGVGHYGWTSGAFDGAAWTGPSSAATDSWNAVALALRPAATGGGASASASGALPLGGTATATAPAAGQASGVLPLSGAATGAALVAGQASGVLPLSGAGTAQSLAKAQGQGVLPLGGSATAATVPVGPGAVASGALPLGGAATAVALVAAQANGVLPLSGTATAVALVKVLADGTLPLGGSAIARAPISADAAGTMPLGGSATAQALVTAQASGSLPFAGSATAVAAPVGDIQNWRQFRRAAHWAPHGFVAGWSQINKSAHWGQRRRVAAWGDK